MQNMMSCLILFFWMTFLTGILYPTVVFLAGQGLFPHQANGSLIMREGRVVGSELLAQKFESDKYFWPRPSAIDYQPMPSGGSNFSQTSEALKGLVAKRRAKVLKTESATVTAEAPPELLFASGSGVDPEISPTAAYFQVDRIVKARKMDYIEGQKLLVDLISSETKGRFLGVVGRNRVNVLRLNLLLDEMK